MGFSHRTYIYIYVYLYYIYTYIYIPTLKAKKVGFSQPMNITAIIIYPMTYNSVKNHKNGLSPSIICRKKPPVVRKKGKERNLIEQRGKNKGTDCKKRNSRFPAYDLDQRARKT